MPVVTGLELGPVGQVPRGHVSCRVMPVIKKKGKTTTTTTTNKTKHYSGYHGVCLVVTWLKLGPVGQVSRERKLDELAKIEPQRQGHLSKHIYDRDTLDLVG